MLVPKPRAKPLPVPSFLNLNAEKFKVYKTAEEIADIKINEFKKEAEEKLKLALINAEKATEEANKIIEKFNSLTKKVEDDFNTVTDELVSVLQDIRINGLKGEDGKDGMDADEEKVIAEVSKMVPKSDEIVKKVLRLIPENKPSVKVITEAIDINAVAEKVKEDLDLESDWKKKWENIKLEISRSKQGYHGGGFNNIALSGTTKSTGLDTLNFTGSGVSSVTQSGRTVTVSIAGGTGFTILPATGTVDDSNVTFTFTQVPTLININGSFYSSTSTIGGNLVWTNVGTTVTLAFPVGNGGSIFGIA